VDPFNPRLAGRRAGNGRGGLRRKR
jgi:hypothetical protein